MSLLETPRKWTGHPPKYALCVGLLGFVGLVSCGERVSVAMIATGPISAGPDWHSTLLTEPVIAKWDDQAVYVHVVTKHDSSLNPMGIYLSNGPPFTPEVAMVSKAGQVERFSFVGFSNSDLHFENDHVARGTGFVELRIRSPIPVACSQIRWISYMPQDTKTGVP